MTLGYASAVSRRDVPELINETHAFSKKEGAGNAGRQLAPADGVTGRGAFRQAALATAPFDGARRAACLEGRRSSLTLMV